MRLDSITHPQQSSRRFSLLGMVLPALIAMAAGCADFRSAAGAAASYFGYNTAAGTSEPPLAPTPGKVPVVAKAPAAEPVDVLILPQGQEIQPVARLEFAVEEGNEDVQLLPPVLPQLPMPPASPTADPTPRPDKVKSPSFVLPTPRKEIPKSILPESPRALSTDTPKVPAVATQLVDLQGSLSGDSSKVVEMNLDEVLRLAHMQNGQAGVAREKLEEAVAKHDLAGKTMLAGFLGGAKMEAERSVWQQRAEVSRISLQSLLDASASFVDLLATRAEFEVARQMESKLKALSTQTQAMAKLSPAFEGDVSSIQTDLDSKQLQMRKCRESAVKSCAKLIYLLGIDPSSQVVLTDRQMVTFDLVNAETPAAELVSQAMARGPSIREIEDLLRFIQAGSVSEGLSWNPTKWGARQERQRVAEASTGHAMATFQDLLAKLTMEIQESRETVLSSRDQVQIARQEFKHATEAYQSWQHRLAQASLTEDRSPSEALQAIRALDTASLAYLAAVHDQDIAQLQLAILTGSILPATDR